MRALLERPDSLRPYELSLPSDPKHHFGEGGWGETCFPRISVEERHLEFGLGVDQARDADAYEADRSGLHVRLLKGRAGGSEDGVLVVGRAGAADLAANQPEVRQLELDVHRARASPVRAEPLGQLLDQLPQLFFELRPVRDVVIEGRLRADRLCRLGAVAGGPGGAPR